MRPIRSTKQLALCAALLCAACTSDLDKSFSRSPVKADAGQSSDAAQPEPAVGPQGDESDALTPSGEETNTNQCNDGRRNGNETAVDCGGGTCAACGIGLSCGGSEDCQSGVCFGECIAAGCANQFRDDQESDTDCGGVCDPCDDGLACDTPADCKSGVCIDDRCTTPSCSDGVKNGVETDVDCGFDSECGTCREGDSCEANQDCRDGACVSDTCSPARCADGIPNGSESAVDCGGDCPACADDLTCNESDDCQSRRCEDDGTGMFVCLPPACDDRVKNGDETDIDCGGSCETRCDETQRCEAAEDCLALVCRRDDDDEFRVCKPPACDDEVRNGDETAIDCGGSCGPCDIGEPCVDHDDCSSNSCDVTCLEPACDDMRKNADEADVDCGGQACEPCATGAACGAPEDCRSGHCEDAVCAAGGAGRACIDGDDCLSGRCDESCQVGGAGSACRDDADCVSGTCGEDGCGLSTVVQDCYADGDCFSDRCVDGVCEPGDNGAACGLGQGCASGLCTDATCAPLDLAIASNGTTHQDMTVVHFTIASGSVAVNWNEIAVLYFFSPEARSNLQTAYESVPSASRLCVELSGGQWVYIWRNAASGAVTETPTVYTAQVHNDTWEPMTNANDHSYAASAGPNPNVAVCRQVGGTWRHVQGNLPPGVSNPCRFVEPDCETMTCDDPGQ